MILGAEVTQAQLTIGALTAASATIGVVFKFMATSPEREAAAYRRGREDERKDCAEDIAALRAELAAHKAEAVTHRAAQEAENSALRAALLRFAWMTKLTPSQRSLIASMLGLRDLPPEDPVAR